MKKFEIALEVHHETARDALMLESAFVKRSQIEDLFFENARGVTARLRRQDTVTRLSCTTPLAEDRPESIVIDFQACLQMLVRFDFREAGRERFVRETFKRHHYLLHLDRFPDAPARLTLEAEAWGPNERRMKRQAVTFLNSIGIPCKIRLTKADIDPVRSEVPLLAESA